MADSSFTSISYGNGEFEHVVQVLFENNPQVLSILKEMTIDTFDGLVDFCAQHNLFNSLKWKNKNATWKEVDDYVKEMMRDLPNFFMWLQNDYATLVHPVPLISLRGYSFWRAFRRLKLGTVVYDPIQARASEERNQVCIHAHHHISSTPVHHNMGGGPSNNTRGESKSAADITLDSSTKTIASYELEFPKFDVSLTPHVTFPDPFDGSTSDVDSTAHRLFTMAITRHLPVLLGSVPGDYSEMTVDNLVLMVEPTLMVDGGRIYALDPPHRDEDRPFNAPCCSLWCFIYQCVDAKESFDDQWRLFDRGNPWYYADPTRRVNVKGVDDQDVLGLWIGTFCAKIQFEDGRYALAIFHEYGEPIIMGGYDPETTRSVHNAESTVRRYYIYLMFMRTAGGTEHGELYIIAPRHLTSIKTLQNVIPRVSDLVLYDDIVGGSIPLPIHPHSNHFEEYLMGNSGEYVAPAFQVPFTSTGFRISTAGEIGDIGHDSEPIRSLGYCMSALFIARIVDSRSRSQGDSYNRGGLTGSSMQSMVYDVPSIIHSSPHVCLERRVIIISVHIPIVRDEMEPTMKFYASTIQSLLDAWGVISVMGDILSSHKLDSPLICWSLPLHSTRSNRITRFDRHSISLLDCATMILSLPVPSTMTSITDIYRRITDMMCSPVFMWDSGELDCVLLEVTASTSTVATTSMDNDIRTIGLIDDNRLRVVNESNHYRAPMMCLMVGKEHIASVHRDRLDRRVDLCTTPLHDQYSTGHFSYLPTTKETSALVNPSLCGDNSKCFGSDSSMYFAFDAISMPRKKVQCSRYYSSHGHGHVPSATSDHLHISDCDVARIGVSSPTDKEHTPSRLHLRYFYANMVTFYTDTDMFLYTKFASLSHQDVLSLSGFGRAFACGSFRLSTYSNSGTSSRPYSIIRIISASTYTYVGYVSAIHHAVNSTSVYTYGYSIIHLMITCHPKSFYHEIYITDDHTITSTLQYTLAIVVSGRYVDSCIDMDSLGSRTLLSHAYDTDIISMPYYMTCCRSRCPSMFHAIILDISDYDYLRNFWNTSMKRPSDDIVTCVDPRCFLDFTPIYGEVITTTTRDIVYRVEQCPKHMKGECYSLHIFGASIRSRLGRDFIRLVSMRVRLYFNADCYLGTKRFAWGVSHK